MGKDGKILSRSELKPPLVKESGYEEVYLTMQIAIRALQKVDSLVKRQRVALSRLEHILISVSQTGSTQLGNYYIQRQKVSDDRNSLLSLLGSHSSQKQEVSVDCDSPLLLLRDHSSQKQEVLAETDLLFSLLSSGAAISDAEKAHWILRDGLLFFKNKL